MNLDISYQQQKGFTNNEENNDSRSNYSLNQSGEEGSKISLFIGNNDNDAEEQDEEEFKEFFNTFDDNKTNKTTRIEELQTTQTQKNLKDFPQIYEKLTNNLHKCSEKWFNCDEKIAQLNEFDEWFLKSFEFSYCYENKSGCLRSCMKEKKNKNFFKENKQIGQMPLKTLIYNPSIDEIFIMSKDVYIDIEIKFRYLVEEIMDELWSHILEVCKNKNLVEEFSICSIQSNIKDPKTKQLIVERANTPYRVILRPTIELKKDLNYFNQKLVSTYAKIDQRFRILAGFLTIWGKKRDLLSHSRLNLNDLYKMLIFFFLHNDYLPSLQKDFKVQPNQIEVFRKSHKNDQDRWIKTKSLMNFAFEDNEINIQTFLKSKQANEKNKSGNSKGLITVGEMLPRFFYYFGLELPEHFEDCQTKDNDFDRQKYILLDSKTGKTKIVDFHYEIETLALKKGLGDRKEIDKGYFLMDPFLGDVITKHLIGRLKREKLIEKVKEYFYNKPYDQIEIFFNNYHYEKIEIEYYVAYKRIMAGNGKDIFDDIDFKNWSF